LIARLIGNGIEKMQVDLIARSAAEVGDRVPAAGRDVESASV
jgi:hypothetical protein